MVSHPCHYWFKQWFLVLVTTDSGSGFSSGRWCSAVWFSDDLRVYSQWFNNYNNIQWNLNANNRNIHDIYRVYVFGPVTGTLHTVLPMAGTETEPAWRRWRRPASRPVLSRYCIFFGVLPFTKANPLYLQCMSVFRASNWYIPYSVTYCRNRAGTIPTPLASACFPSGSVSVLYFLWSVTFY